MFVVWATVFEKACRVISDWNEISHVVSSSKYALAAVSSLASVKARNSFNGYNAMFYYRFSYIRVMNATTGSVGRLPAATRFQRLNDIVFMSREHSK